MPAAQFTDVVFPLMVILKSDAGQCKVRLSFEVVAIPAVDHVAAVAAFIDIDSGHGAGRILRNRFFWTSALPFCVSSQKDMADGAVVPGIKPRCANLAPIGLPSFPRFARLTPPTLLAAPCLHASLAKRRSVHWAGCGWFCCSLHRITAFARSRTVML